MIKMYIFGLKMKLFKIIIKIKYAKKKIYIKIFLFNTNYLVK